MRMTDLRPGWTVIANDGHRVGTIEDVGQHYVVTSRKRLPRLYIPASAIANVEKEAVHLNLAQHEAEQMGWEQPPRGDDTLQTTGEADLDRHI